MDDWIFLAVFWGFVAFAVGALFWRA